MGAKRRRALAAALGLVVAAAALRGTLLALPPAGGPAREPVAVPASGGDAAGAGAGSASGAAGRVGKPGGEAWASAEDYELDEPLERASAGVLEEYEALGGCALVQAGYLDLFGSTWACVVSGDGWAELCLVRRVGGNGDSQTSRLRVVHLGGGDDEGVDRG